mgnify:FL=1
MAQRRPRSGQRPAQTRRPAPNTVTPQPMPRTAAPTRVSNTQAASIHHPTGIVSPWGRVDEEFAMIRSDLRRLLILTALIIAVLIALTFVLR